MARGTLGLVTLHATVPRTPQALSVGKHLHFAAGSWIAATFAACAIFSGCCRTVTGFQEGRRGGRGRQTRQNRTSFTGCPFGVQTSKCETTPALGRGPDMMRVT